MICFINYHMVSLKQKGVHYGKVQKETGSN